MSFAGEDDARSMIVLTVSCVESPGGLGRTGRTGSTTSVSSSSSESWITFRPPIVGNNCRRGSVYRAGCYGRRATRFSQNFASSSCCYPMGLCTGEAWEGIQYCFVSGWVFVVVGESSMIVLWNADGEF